MKLRQILTAVLLTVLPLLSLAQKVKVTATYVDENNNMVEADTDFEREAPLDVTFHANPQEMDDLTPSYEWHFRKEGAEKDLMVRYEEETQYTFTESGKFTVTVKVFLTDMVEAVDSSSISITISESKLEMPNAFSPNGDQKNEIYRAKKGKYKSIVEFHAYIFNRHGQKLFEWTDITQGWDGTYHGSPVKEGVYFVLVKAKGADGRVYNIRKDVNLLRSFTPAETSNSSTE